MLRCLTTRPTSCCLVFSTSDLWFLIVWSCLGDATLLNLDYLTLCCLMSPTSGRAFWSGLHDARLLDCLYLMLRCWTFPTVCYVSWCSLSHVMLFDLVIKTVRCLTFPTSCYVLDLPLLCCLCSLYLVEFFVWSSCCYAAWPSLPLVRLLGLPYLTWCCLMCSVSFCAIRSCPHDATLHDSLRQTTLLDHLLLMLCFMFLHQIVLRCLVLSSWCYAAWSSLHHALLQSELIASA